MQNKAKLFRSMGGSPLVAIGVSLLGLLSAGAFAQVSQATSTVAAVIPQQVRYTGALPNRPGDIVEAVFRIYATAEGGEALWTETQRVSVSADGSYSVLLGAASQGGLPQTVFAAGQARWVGVSIDRAEEQSRSPLSSVAYAMKAGDAESVGGLSAANLVTKDELAKLAQTVATTTVQAQPAIQPETTPTGSGTANYVPLWTASATLGNSGIYQAASGFVGIGTTTPGGPLQLATGATGGANATMMLTQTSAASGNYYADIGLYNSHGLIGNLSALGAGYPAGNLFGANDVVFLGGQQNAGTNLIFLTNTSGALKFGSGGYAKANERMRIGATGGVSVGNSYVTTDPGAGNLIVSGNVGIGTTAPAAVLEVNGTAKFDGLITFDAGQTFPGTGTITGVTATSPLTGGGTSGAVTLGLNTPVLETTLNSVYARLGAADTFADGATFSKSITANGTGGATGVTGTSDTGLGVVGLTSSPAGDTAAVLGYTSGEFSGVNQKVAGNLYTGVSADAISGNGGATAAGLLATSDNGFGAVVENASTSWPAIYVENRSGRAAQIEASGSTGAALVVSANDDYAGEFTNKSSTQTTLLVENGGAGGVGNAGRGTPGMFDTLMATSATGTCGIGSGSMSCTGPMKSLVSSGGGSRTVETYAMQSPENWMEDFGSGAVERGVGVVQIDPAFAETVTADANYHVFLTPRGDSPGHLYVTNVTASSFEVRESSGGMSSIGFDYRIVAKRRGYEDTRLTDVTDAFHREMETGAEKALAARKPMALGQGTKAQRTIVPGPTPGAVLRQARAVPVKQAASQ
jgi:hypothetical protein